MHEDAAHDVGDEHAGAVAGEKTPEPRPGVPFGKLAGRRKRSSRGANSSASRWSQTWLPVVTTSAPAASVSRKISSVMPKPPAAFSPLTMTKSSLKSEIRPGRLFPDGRAAGTAHHVAQEEKSHVPF